MGNYVSGAHCTMSLMCDTIILDLRVVVEPLCALCALGAGVALLAHAVARLVALLALAAVRVAARPRVSISIMLQVFVQHIFAPHWPMNQLNKNPNIAFLTSNQL